MRRIIGAAQRYIGIKESPPGSNNVIFNTRYYGRAVSGKAYPWCCAFIWCLFQDIGSPELFYGGNKTASCTELMSYAKATGLFHTSNFQPGDLAFFNFAGTARDSEHIGIVEEVKSSSVITIEGNTSWGSDSDGGEVMRRVRNNALIIGVYRPKYGEEEEDVPFTYEEFQQFMAKHEEEKGKQVPADWSRDDRLWAEAVRLIQGDEKGNLKYKQEVTREQMVVFLHRLYNLLNGGA